MRLAWTAGFFDGEGSTIVYECRPGYLRLVVPVPQSGAMEAPEVLTRFQEAMLGLGETKPLNDEGMWFWRARSAEEGQAAIAFMWPHLGSVKRAQAAGAIRRFHAQYGPRGLKPRHPRRRRGAHAIHVGPPAVAQASRVLDLPWAAGFLDAEGCFGVYRSMKRKKGPPWRRVRVSASQHGEIGRPPQVLERLQRILGLGRIERHGEADDHKWLAEGADRV